MIALKFTHFLAVSQLNSWSNAASNTASRNCAKNWYTLIEQSCRNIAVTALLEYLDLHACFVLAAAGDYIHLLILSATVVDLLLQCMGSHCQEHSCMQCSHLVLQFRGLYLLWIQDSLSSKHYHYKTIYVEKLQ